MKTCEHCKKEFPNYIKIDGKLRNLCARKFCLECSPFGQGNRSSQPWLKAETITHKTCITCKQSKPSSEFHFDQHHKRYRSYCKACDHARVKQYQNQNKAKCIEYLGGKCVICGYNKYIGALDFHHRDPNKKEFTIAKFAVYNLEKLKPELDKCVLLCARCHREVHGGVAQLPN